MDDSNGNPSVKLWMIIPGSFGMILQAARSSEFHSDRHFMLDHPEWELGDQKMRMPHLRTGRTPAAWKLHCLSYTCSSSRVDI